MIDQTLAAQRPLFLVQDAPPGEEHLALLAARLAAQGPVHCLRAEMADGVQPATVEGMAAVLVQAVRRVQPAGPYRLAGCGFGGLLAYEAAIQLIGLDAPVELVALVDTPCPQGPQPSTPASSLHAQAIADYLVQRISVPIDLFVHAATDAPGAAHDPLLGWGGLLPRELVRVSQVPGPGRSTQAGDVDALAGLLSCAIARPLRASEPKDRPEVAIRTGRAGAALFCVPGAGDSVVGFAPLAAVLGDDFSLYGLQPRGTDGELVPHSSVRAAATHYVQAVQRVRPHGPLHLFGHSFGGWIVFEMAHQLRALGRSIASLTVVDSEAPDGREGGLGEEHGAGQALARFVEVLELAAGQPLGVDPASLARLHPAAMRKQLHAAMARSGLLPARSSPDVLAGPIRTFATALRTSYRPPRAYGGVVRLVLVADTRFSAEDNQRHQIACLSGWQAWAPRTRLWIGPGNHMTVLKDANVRALCRWWTDAVATADAAH